MISFSTTGNWVGVFPHGNTRQKLLVVPENAPCRKKRPQARLGYESLHHQPQIGTPLMRRRHAISEPREPQYWQQPIDEQKRATDDNGCRWEWKFSLDADRRPELSCRCRTCALNTIYPVGSGPSTQAGMRNVNRRRANICARPPGFTRSPIAQTEDRGE